MVEPPATLALVLCSVANHDVSYTKVGNLKPHVGLLRFSSGHGVIVPGSGQLHNMVAPPTSVRHVVFLHEPDAGKLKETLAQVERDACPRRVARPRRQRGLTA